MRSVSAALVSQQLLFFFVEKCRVLLTLLKHYYMKLVAIEKPCASLRIGTFSALQSRKQAKSKGKHQKMHSPGIEPGARQDRLVEEMAMPNFTTKPQVLHESCSQSSIYNVHSKKCGSTRS
jgi:hypothetical protein